CGANLAVIDRNGVDVSVSGRESDGIAPGLGPQDRSRGSAKGQHRSAQARLEWRLVEPGLGVELLCTGWHPRPPLVDAEPDEDQRHDHQLSGANDETVEVEVH